MKRSFEEDKCLLARCIAGDNEARDALVVTFSNLVYEVVLHTFRSKGLSFERDDVEDLHNTIFLKIFEKDCRKLRQYQGKNGCSLATWIRLIAAGIALDHVRKRGIDSIVGQKAKVPLDEVFGLEAPQKDALKLLEEAEQRRLLDEAVEHLPPQHRLFIKLHLERGQPMPRVATALQLSMNNTYALKHRVTVKLREYMTKRQESACQT